MLRSLFGAARRSRPTRRFTPVMEQLDDRIVPTVSTLFANGVVTITSDSLPDTINLSTSANNEILYFNATISDSLGTVATLSNTTSISVLGNGGNDTIDLSGLTGYTGSVTIDGGNGADELTGSAGSDLIRGGNGNDFLDGGAGDDTLIGGDNDDELHGGDNNDTLRDGNGIDEFYGDAGDDTLEGLATTANTFTISGTNLGALNFQLFEGVENLRGGTGDDSFNFLSSFFTMGEVDGDIDGGAGVDALSFAGRNQGGGVSVDLTAGTATSVGGSVSLIEDVEGSKFADILKGNSEDNELIGNDGDNTLYATSGVDTFIGGNGNDTLVGENTDNTFNIVGINFGSVDGRAFSSVENLDGSGGNDVFKFSLLGVAQVNSVTGGAGVNTLDYASRPSGVTVDLTTGAATGIGGGAAGQVSLIQNVIGSAFADTLVGNSGNNVLVGGAGNDTIDGGTGRDILIGGDGIDTLTGGSGEDILIAGSTAHDNIPATLNAIRSVWIGSSPYADRVATLSGLGGLLASANMIDDGLTGVGDSLTGGTGLDYFWVGSGDTTDLVPADEEFDVY